MIYTTIGEATDGINSIQDNVSEFKCLYMYFRVLNNYRRGCAHMKCPQ